MKGFIWVPVACLIGLLIGGWGPREEVRSLKETLDEERRIHAARPTDGFNSFAQMVNIPDTARRRRPRRDDRERNREETREGASVTTNASITVEAGPDAPPQHPPRRPMMRSQDLRARIDEAKALWQTRVDVARAQWISKLKLDGEAVDRFDEALNAMNNRLYDGMAAMAEQLAGEEEMTPEIGLRLANVLTGAMAETYEQIGALVPPELRGEVSKMTMHDFIDPAVGEPLIAVQDKLEKMPNRLQGR
ncbi:MAG: hypothetical protein J6334_11550 [Kiritimatiellae bacterium]|nr:hypothetical protein [Kiritimatiellia bacterium]